MNAKWTGICCALNALIMMSPAMAEIPRAQPILVATIHGSIPAKPFFERLEHSPGRPSQSLTYEEKPLAMADRLPLESTKLRRGMPSLVVADGLTSPLFVIALDALSLRWFEENLDDLRHYGARGLVVAASNKSSWTQFREKARARGVDLQLMDENVLIEGYGLESYPALIVGSVVGVSEATR